jgi:hypothetical protein
MERFQGFKFHEKSERNTFAFSKSHKWMWHYSIMVPKCFQYKSITPALDTLVDKGRKNADSNGLGARPTISS